MIARFNLSGGRRDGSGLRRQKYSTAITGM